LKKIFGHLEKWRRTMESNKFRIGYALAVELDGRTILQKGVEASEVIVCPGYDMAVKISKAMIGRNFGHALEKIAEIVSIEQVESSPRMAVWGDARDVWLSIVKSIGIKFESAEFIRNPSGQVVGFLPKNGKEAGDGRGNGDKKPKSCSSELERQA
jgi:hypothetical protein